MAKEKEPSGRGAPDAQENRVQYADRNDGSIGSRYGGLIFAGVVLGLILLAIAADLLL